MERNEQYNNDQYNRRNRNSNQNEEMNNASGRYRSGGNYYGMSDAHEANHNVRHTKGDNYSQSAPGPVGGYGASSYRGTEQGQSYSNRNSDNYNAGSGYYQGNSNHQGQHEHYRYGDPNAYMQGLRNTQSGRSGNSGYDYNEERGYGTTGQHYSGNYQSGNNSGNQSDNRYSRQDNSYQMDGEGRRYNEFARDEQRSYNPGNIDMYQGRDDFNYSRSDNDFGSNRRDNGNQYFEGGFDNDDIRYGNAEIRDTNRSRNQNENQNRTSSRRSGPDYSADSPISGFGQSDLRG